MTTEPLAVGRRVFVGGRASIAAGSVAGGVNWRNVLIVDKDGGGDHTTIQAAISAATSPSSSNPWLVLVMPGVYNEVPALVSFVHVAALVPETVNIVLASAMSSVDDCTLQGLKFTGLGSTTTAITVTSTHDDFVMRECILDSCKLDAGGGRYEDCFFLNGRVEFGGASADTNLPVFSGCSVDDATTSGVCLTSLSTTSHGLWSGGSVNITGSDDSIAVSITSRNVSFTGTNFISGDRRALHVRCRFSGCHFYIVQNDTLGQGLSIGIEIDGAEFSGCQFFFEGIATGANAACFAVMDQTVRDSVFTGCKVYNHMSLGDPAFFLFDDGIITESFGLKINGTTFECGSGSSTVGNIFETHTSGFTGKFMVTLNGNHYHGAQATMPSASPGSGTLKFRGRDVKTEFWPVSMGLGTGASTTVERHPVVDLGTAAENAFVGLRVSPPAGVTVGAQLVVSAENSNGIHVDSFTDVDGTLLAAHASDSGGAWINTSNDIQISSNQITPVGTPSRAFGIYSVGAANGRVSLDNASAPGSGSFERVAGVIFRFSDTNNYWRLTTGDDPSGTRLIRRVAGSETTMWSAPGGTSASLVAEFFGNTIRWWVSGVLFGEIEDSALASNTGVGVLLGNIFGGTIVADGFQFVPGGDVDLTAEVSYGVWGQPYTTSPTAVTAAAAAVGHRSYTYVDISSLLPAVPEERLAGFEVTLDALNGDITNLYVHGVQYQMLPVMVGESAFSNKEPENGIIHR